MEIKADVPQIAELGVVGVSELRPRPGLVLQPHHRRIHDRSRAPHRDSRFLAPMDQTHTLTSGLTYHDSRTRLWGAVALEYGSGTPGGHGGGDHEHEEGEAHEHATGPGLCGTRCPSHFTQERLDRLECDVDRNGRACRSSSTSRTCRTRSTCCRRRARWCRGRTSIPRLFSGSLKIGF